MPADNDYNREDGAFDSPALAPSEPGVPGRIPLNRSSSSLSGLARRGAERVGEDLGESLVLLGTSNKPPPTNNPDVIETFFDSRLDLWERRLKEQSARLRKRADELIPKGLRTPGGTTMLLLDSDDEGDNDSSEPTATATARHSASRRLTAKYKADMDREVSRMKVKLAEKVNGLSRSWRSAKTVRTREKICAYRIRYPRREVGRAGRWGCRAEKRLAIFSGSWARRGAKRILCLRSRGLGFPPGRRRQDTRSCASLRPGPLDDRSYIDRFATLRQ